MIAGDIVQRAPDHTRLDGLAIDAIISLSDGDLGVARVELAWMIALIERIDRYYGLSVSELVADMDKEK